MLIYIYTWQWPTRKLIGYFGHRTQLNTVFLPNSCLYFSLYYCKLLYIKLFLSVNIVK